MWGQPQLNCRVLGNWQRCEEEAAALPQAAVMGNHNWVAETIEIHFSQFWKLEVQEVSSGSLTSGGLREKPSHASLQFLVVAGNPRRCFPLTSPAILPLASSLGVLSVH